MEKSEDYSHLFTHICSPLSALTPWLVVSIGEEYMGINRIRRKSGFREGQKVKGMF